VKDRGLSWRSASRSLQANDRLAYAGAATTNMFFYFVQTFQGPDPPEDTAYYRMFNLPWLIAPMILGLRVALERELLSEAASP